MASPQRPRTRYGFSIALICALRKESDAVLALFDGHWRDHGGEFTKVEGDKNIYWTGWIGTHNVVLVQMPGMGNTNAASVASTLLTSFPRIRLSLVIGICGGVPGRTKQEMILGDVVISTRIIQLSLASRYPDALVMKETHRDHLGQLNGEVVAFLEQMQGKESFRRLQSETTRWTQVLQEKDFEDYHYPGTEDDKLYQTGYRHKHQDVTICDICACCEKYEDPVCGTARREPCTQLGCDESKLVPRQRLQDVITAREGTVPKSKRTSPNTVARIPEPTIHFGPVGSGDWVIKSQIHRDSVNNEVIAYEMEGSGVSHTLPTLVIKSVCDYADSHKNKDWQNYAAATAAACMKAILHTWPNVDYSRNSGVNEYVLASDDSGRQTQVVPKTTRYGTEQLIFDDEERKRQMKQREWYLQALGFDQINSRHETIKSAHANTCGWLLARPEYRHWLMPEEVPQRSFFWIKGKPGSGKSTIMKYLLTDIIRQAQDSDRVTAIVLPFFFNARGEDLEKSTIGLYRTLLFLLLHQDTRLQRVLDTLPRFNLKTGKPDFNGWTIETLQRLFEQSAHKVRTSASLICVIDALDECEEAQVREMVTFFENLSDSGGDHAARNCFRTCFSSRHYPHITVNNSIELVLEDQEDHRQDIASYLRVGLRGHGQMVDEIKVRILERSSGIFLWVCLVVKILNIEYDHGRIHAMRKRLDEIPDGLDDLFYDILTRDTQRMDELILALQLLLFARRPLYPEELYHAILVGIEPESLVPWDSKSGEEEAVQRFILSTSKGLAEVTRNGTVQFIHESVRDYFLKEKGLQRLWPDLVDNFQGLSHDKLRQYSQNYVDFYISQDPSLTKQMEILPEEKIRSSAAKFPFLEYASRDGIFHADAAVGFGIVQIEPIENFSLRHWISFRRVFGRGDFKSLIDVKSALPIFAMENLANLIHLECEKDRIRGIQRQDYEEALTIAISHRNENAIRALLTPAGGLRPEDQQPYLSDERHEAVIRYFMSRPAVGDTLLSAAEYGKVDVVAALLRTKMVQVDRNNHFGPTPLWLAVKNGNQEVVRLLLETGLVDVNFPDSHGQTPLSFVATSGNQEVARLLLRTGQVDINIRNHDSQTPLSVAAMCGNQEVVRLLLGTGQVDINIADDYGWTPFMWAVRRGHEAVVQQLLKTGEVDIGQTDIWGQTALSFAIDKGHVGVVRLIVDWQMQIHKESSVV